VFVGEALLALWLGTVRGRLTFAAERGAGIGIALYVYALALHPLLVLVAGRPLQAAEVVGIAPDPTAIATLGLLSLAPRRGGTLPLIILPILWCLANLGDDAVGLVLAIESEIENRVRPSGRIGQFMN